MAEDLVAGELTVTGQLRTFSVRPPARLDAPLVVVLHGNMSSDAERRPFQGAGQFMDPWVRFGAHAGEWDFAIAYPDGWQGSWADGRGVTGSDEAGVDDIAFLRALIGWCADRFGTRWNQTILAGISNGAFMSHRAALELGELVPVFAAVAGAFPAALSDILPTHAVSAILINGTADLVQSIQGGYSRRPGSNGELQGRTLGLAESAQRWREIDRCRGAETTVTTPLAGRHTVDGGVGGTRVAAWTVFNGDHWWPGAPRPDRPTTPEFDATAAILRFVRPLLIPAQERKL
ncbi:hypothetical protein [Nocardia sp. NPDC004604]|uniref:alpha/beta hydrolase family esterase n=1 Tax=Nocardia sp. NPDC004604 TaxID=3157013 RepID=UPI0033B46297